MTDAPPARTAVIAVGRADEGDHAVGLVTADILRRRLGDQVTVIHLPAGVVDLDEVARHEAVFVVIAAPECDRPGAVARVDVRDEVSTGEDDRLEELGLREIVALVRREGTTPRAMVLYRIEGKRFTTQAGVSPEVALSAHRVADEILTEVSTPA